METAGIDEDPRVDQVSLYGLHPRGSLIWSWQYRGLEAEADPLRAAGLLVSDADGDGDGLYDVDAITGRRNGVRITGLVPAGEAIPGNVNPGTGDPYTGDNQLRSRGQDDAPQLSGSGLQFSLTDGTYSNVFNASFLSPPTDLEFHAVPPFPDGAIPPNSEPAVTFAAWIVAVVV
jgi:hypothetical protein